MTEPLEARYEELARLTERQLELAGEGRFEELFAVGAAVNALIAELPAEPPAGAREALEQAVLTHRRLTIEIMRGRDGLLLELAQVERGRRAASGYAPHRDRRQRVSTSA